MLERSQSLTVFPSSFDEASQVEPLAFGNSAKLKLTGPLCLCHLSGSPVLAWRRQHRRSLGSSHSTLPPLERGANGYSHTSLGHGKRRHMSVPPGLVVFKAPASPSGLQPLLWCGVEQGPALRPSMPSAVISARSSNKKVGLKPQVKEMSAIALDLLSEKDISGMMTKGGAKVALDNIVDLVNSPAQELRQENAAPSAASDESSLERAYRQFLQAHEGDAEEFFADNDDGEFVCLSHVPIRVRPGDILNLKPKMEDADVQDLEEEFTEDDMAYLAAESAVDMGLQRFYMDLVNTMDNIVWADEEEV